MESTTPNPSPPHVNRLGRTAWLIMGVAFAMSGTMIVPALVFRERFTDSEDIVLIVVGAIIGAVLLLWSAVQSLRALYAGAKSKAHLAILMIALGIPAVLGIGGWSQLADWRDRSANLEIAALLGCVLMPFIFLAFST